MTGIATFWIALASAATAPEVIQDCAECPRMIVVPPGKYSVGSPVEEPGRYPNERPISEVVVTAFAIGETEITRRQFASFIGETGHEMAGGCYTPGNLDDLLSDVDPGASWLDPRFEQTADHPVVCVSWHDAVAYADWLSSKTGYKYSLPNEILWEAAARGGTTTAYFWGQGVKQGCAYGNGGDLSLGEKWPKWAEVTEAARRRGEQNSVLVKCRDGYAFTAPSKSFLPNPFGLFDMTGNVWEWVQDCGDNQNPSAGLAEGAASDACQRRRTRGGSWDDWPVDLRSAVRKRLEPSFRRNDTGFRLVRQID